MPHLHTLKLGGHLAAAQLELLDDVADLLEAVRVPGLAAAAVGAADDQEGGALEQDYLPCRDDEGRRKS